MANLWGQERERLAELFACAVFWNGNRAAAQQILCEAAQKLARRPEVRERERGLRSLYCEVWRACQKSHRHPSPPLPTEEKQQEPIAQFSQSLTEPQRCLAALYYLSRLEPEQMARVIGLGVKELGQLLTGVRRMASSWLGKDQPQTQPPEPNQEALSRTWLAQQADPLPAWAELDAQVCAILKECTPSDEERAKLDSICSELENRAAKKILTWRDPGIIGLILGSVLLCGVVAWLIFSDNQEEAARSVLERLLKEGANTSAGDYEPVEVSLEELGDWLALQGVEDFWVPEGFSEQVTLAARVFDHQGSRAAAVLLPEHHLVVYFFKTQGTPLEGTEESNQWSLMVAGEDAAAWQVRRGLCFMVAHRGTLQRLVDILNMIKPQI